MVMVVVVVAGALAVAVAVIVAVAVVVVVTLAVAVAVAGAGAVTDALQDITIICTSDLQQFLHCVARLAGWQLPPHGELQSGDGMWCFTNTTHNTREASDGQPDHSLFPTK